MNVSRLAEFVDILAKADAKYNFQKRLNRIASKLGEIMTQPNTGQGQNELVQMVAELRTSLVDIQASFTPAVLSFLDDLGAVSYFTEEMADYIETKLHTNSVTPAVVKGAVEELTTNRVKVLDAIKALAANLPILGLNPEPLEPGQAEIGFKIPRALFANTLLGFAKELKFIEHLVETFSEAVTGKREKATLAELSTTDPLILLLLDAKVVASIAASISWLLLTYKQVLEINELRQKLKQYEVKDSLKELDEKIDAKVTAAINQRVAEVVAKRSDKARENELGNELRIALRQLLEKIERGMTVEVKFIAPPPEGDGSPEQTEREREFLDLARIQQELVFPPIPAEPMLRITKVDDEGKPKPRQRRTGRNKPKDGVQQN